MAYHTLALVQVLSLLGQVTPPATKPPAPAAAAPGKPAAGPATPPAKAGDKAAPTAPGKPAAAPGAPAAKLADKAASAAAAAAPKPAAKPRPKAPVAPAAPRPPEAGSKSETEALRAEVAALRTELGQVVGTPPPAAKETPDPNQAERQRVEAQLAEEKTKLAAILKAVEGGLERAAVADSIERAEAQIKELDATLAKLQPPAAAAAQPEPRVPSLYETNAALRRVEAKVDSSSAPSASAASGPAAAPSTANAAAGAPDAKPAEGEDELKAVSLLPLEFTAFGDFYYQFARPDDDGFHIGAIELDAALKLSSWVNVATAIVFNGEDEDFDLGAFVIDSSLVGEGDDFPIKSKFLQKSGVSFGKFDVPFGTAYLEYPAVSNRLVTQPQAVAATHGGWSDVGAQGYAIAEHWTGTAYLVNGPDYPTNSGEDEPARSAAGGRLSARLAGAELGGSGAWVFGPNGAAELFAGADLSGVFGPLDLRAEYLLKRVDAEGPRDTHGVYGRAILNLEPAFLVGRYDTVIANSSALDRRFTLGGGVEIFPQGEVRAVYEQSVDSDVRMVLLQLVGGSTFQPTGLRR